MGTFFRQWIDQIRKFSDYRNTLIATLVVCAVTLLSRHDHFVKNFLPRDYYTYILPAYFSFYGLIFIFVPLVSIFLMKTPSDRFGFRMGNVKLWSKDVLVSLAILLILIMIFGRNRDFLRTYPLFKPAGESWEMFLIGQGSMLIYMAGWEFIFRGYLLFTARKEIGDIPAIFLQMLPFAYMHLGKPELETFGSIFAGLFLGMIALRAGSFLPCAILHFLVSFSMDTFAILYKGSLLCTR
jgi:membrane protease YdiL (CAAX protease family)